MQKPYTGKKMLADAGMEKGRVEGNVKVYWNEEAVLSLRITGLET